MSNAEPVAGIRELSHHHTGAPPPAIRPAAPAWPLPPHTLAAQSLPLLVARVALRLSRSAAQFYGQHWQIGTTEYRLLLALGTCQGCNALQLSAIADVDPGATSRSLQQLARRGWVQRLRHGREMQVRLTDAGQQRLAHLRRVSKAREHMQLQGLGQAEQGQLRAHLETLLHNLNQLDAQAASPPSEPTLP